MRLLFLNQYFPPDAAPTGVLLREVADALALAGHVVDFVDAQEPYRLSEQKGGRMQRDLKALAKIFWTGLGRQRPDVIVSASSPACLLVVATALALWHRARGVHWVMDLYPEIAISLGVFRPGLLSRVIGGVMASCYRLTERVVVLDEDMAAKIRAYGVKAAVVRPWVFAPVIEQSAAVAHAAPDPRWTWIYSGNLGRAHDWQTLLEVQAILEARGAGCRLLFQGGGHSRAVAEARAKEMGLKSCAWTGYVEEALLPQSLVACQLLAITQLPGAQGLLWPSKLALAISLPRPLLWIGPKDGAVANFLRQFPHAGVFSAGQAAQIADWIIALKQRPTLIEATATFDAADHRQRSIEQLTALILEAGARRENDLFKHVAGASEP